MLSLQGCLTPVCNHAEAWEVSLLTAHCFVIRRKISLLGGVVSYTGILSGMVWVQPISCLIQNCADASIGQLAYFWKRVPSYFSFSLSLRGAPRFQIIKKKRARPPLTKSPLLSKICLKISFFLIKPFWIWRDPPPFGFSPKRIQFFYASP